MQPPYYAEEELARPNFPASFGPEGRTTPQAAAVLAVPLYALVIRMILELSTLACLVLVAGTDTNEPTL